jgi:hypothetical protein
MGNFPRGAADELHELAARNLVPHDRVDDVVQARSGAGLRSYVFEELLGVGDPPAGRRVDPDELPPFGGDLVGVAIPDEEALLEAAYVLHEGKLDVQPCLGDRCPHGPAELDDDRLLALLQRVEGPGDDDEDRQREDPESNT